MTAGVDRHELRQIIAGLSEGVILVEPDQTIAYANEAALAMHGAESLDEIGPTVDAYRERFALRYRNHRARRATRSSASWPVSASTTWWSR